MRQDKLNLIKELPKDKVEVEDTEGLRWIVSTEALDRFQKTGFLHVPKGVSLAFQQILNGRNFGDLSEQEKYDVITKIIEAATHEPLEASLPHLAQI